ncbi:hypothetical protein ACB092_11G185300 [Castanea dentata]
MTSTENSTNPIATNSSYCTGQASAGMEDPSLNPFFLSSSVVLVAAVLLWRFNYDQDGNSKWMATLVQTAAFPILLIPFFLIHFFKEPSTSLALRSFKILALIYFSLRVLIATFNAVFSYLIISKKFTALILNSVNDDSDGPSGVSKWQCIIGFLYTLRAFALHSLSLSLMHFPFRKVLKSETYSVVLGMQICTALVATCFAGERVSYVMTLVWTAVAWQVCSVGVVLFIASVAITPIASIIVFHDKMNGIMEIAMLLVFWSFASHIK